MITIGIPVRNQLGFVQRTIRSVLAFITHPIQLIIVDDASEKETSDYLNKLASIQTDIKVIHNCYREGFAFNANLILDKSEGDIIILLNSDTVVTRYWDINFLRALSSPDAGLAGPSTSCCHTPQALLEYRFGRFDISDAEIDKYSEDISQKYKGQKVALKHLGGFCLAISRKAFKAAGYFDERFGLGPYEENDYADRVIKKNLKVEWIKDIYVHHFGGCSFNEDGVKFCNNLRENSRIFYEAKYNGNVEHEWVRRNSEGKIEEYSNWLELRKY